MTTAAPAPECLYQVIDAIEEVNERMIFLHGEIDYVEDCIKDVYHFIELDSLDAVKTMKVCKKLKQLLIERRVLRDENAMIMTFRASFNADHHQSDGTGNFILKRMGKVKKDLSKKLDKYSNRDYSERRITLNSILENK